MKLPLSTQSYLCLRLVVFVLIVIVVLRWTGSAVHAGQPLPTRWGYGRVCISTMREELGRSPNIT